MMNRDFLPFEPLDMTITEPALVTRPGADIHVTRLTPADAAFLAAIGAGVTLEQAAASGMQAGDDFDLNRALTTLLEKGACTAITPDAKGDHHG